MKEFKTPKETIEFLKEGDIGIAVSDVSNQATTKDTSFIVFKINRVSSYNLRRYYHGNFVHASFIGFTNATEIKIEIKQDDLVFWKDDDGSADIMSLYYYSDDTKNKFKICILEEKDNPEVIFQKMLKIGKTSESTFNSLELIVKNILSL